MIPGWPPASATEARHRIAGWRRALQVLDPATGPVQILREIEKWLPRSHPLYSIVVMPTTACGTAFVEDVLDGLAKSLPEEGGFSE